MENENIKEFDIEETDEIDDKEVEEIMNLPILPLRGLTVFPDVMMPFDAGRRVSMKAIEIAMTHDRRIALIPQKDIKIDEVDEDDLYPYGVVAVIKQLVKMPNNNVRVLVEGLSVCSVIDAVKVGDYITGKVQTRIVKEDASPEAQEISEKNRADIVALSRQMLDMFFEFAEITRMVPDEVIFELREEDNVEKIGYIVASQIGLNTKQGQQLLVETNVEKRLKMIYRLLEEELHVVRLEKSLNEQVKESFEERQKEAYLKEKFKVIANEIQDMGAELPPVNMYNDDLRRIEEQVAEKEMPEHVNEKIFKEMDRLARINPMSPEYGNSLNYIETVLSLPWRKEKNKPINLTKAQRILDKNHYGMQEVKDRILDFLAVKSLTNSLKGPIICLYGPPGVGKTSIAKSVAEALDRPYVRLSLGGTHDESDIRGHRRTYVSSMPGRIINAMKDAKKTNALILLDEVDKVSGDFKGNLASALLEVLDSEQNNRFRDHFIELEYDLSDVFFITTANDLSTIERPLLDRMEIIELSSYTEIEKFNIAKKHLINKQLVENGLKKSMVSFTAGAINEMILCYTKEAGVRSLERCIGKVCRKVARIISMGEQTKVKIDVDRIHEFLGAPKYLVEKADKTPEIGVATGLAYTSVGGETLKIEVNTFKGSGQLQLTGKLGDVMKESAITAFSWIKANASELGIHEDFAKEIDVHIHVPEGAVPKDGPSAGITLVTAMVSQFTGRPVDNYLAMTGEVTLRGRVLPIGGLKEKLIGARRFGIKTVLIPKENETDLEKIPEEVKDKIQIISVENVWQVLDKALGEK